MQQSEEEVVLDATFIIDTLKYLAFASVGLFFFQALTNVFLYKDSIHNKKLIGFHIGLCGTSMLYSLLIFFLTLGLERNVNLLLLHLTWMTGSLVSFYYISSMKLFLNDQGPGLTLMRKLPLISCAGAFFAFLAWKIFNWNLFVDATTPIIAYKNVFMMKIGGFNPSPFVKVLSLFVMIPTLHSLFYFLNYIRKTKTPEKLLVTGIIISLCAILNDITISFLDISYLVPFMFLANICEILRISYVTQMEMSKEVSSLKEDLIQSHKFSEAGNHYAFLAHEILNPLTAAKGYFQLLLKKTNSDDPKINKYIDVINQQHTRIENLALNVKQYTRSDQQTDPQFVEVDSIINEAIETIQLRADKAGIVIHYSPESTGSKIYCHKDQLIQVMINLMNNSMDAISENPEKWITVECGTEQEKVFITVTDSGKGIPKELQEKIWEHRFTSKKETGTGIGLTICRTIIKNHKGEINLNPSSSFTQFKIKLPLNRKK